MAQDYVEAVEVGSALIERHAVLQSPTKIEELVGIFIHATKVNVFSFCSPPSTDIPIDGDGLLGHGIGQLNNLGYEPTPVVSKIVIYSSSTLLANIHIAWLEHKSLLFEIL